MTETRKLLSIFAGITFVAFTAFQTMSMTNVSATYGGGDNCNDIFTYEKTSDFSDSRVSINFESNDYQIDVSGVGSYQVIEVSLDVSNDGFSGYHVYATGPVSNFNPNPGDAINTAKVKVKKVCATPTLTPTVTPRPTNVPTQAPTAIPTSVPTSVPTAIPTAVPTAIPSVSPVPTIVEQDVNPSVSPEPTVTSTPTVTPTDTPSSSTNNNSSSNDSSSNNEVKVAGISALASTGGIIDSLMNSVFVSGLLTFAFGLKRHGKKS